VNVLYHSGAVQAQTPESIDPRASDVWLANWRPHRDTFELDGAADEAVATKSAGEQFFAGIASGSTNDDTLGPVLTQTSVPDYPPVDPSSCADSEFDGDNLNGSIYSATYDAANDYPALFESPPGSGNFYPFFGDQQAKFRTPPYVPADLIGEPYSADYLIAEGHQAPDTTEATFTFNVEPGRYNVWIHWPGHVRHSDTTPIKVLDDTTQLHTETVNQEVYSGQAALDAGKTPLVETNDFGQELSWYPLGEHETTSGVLKIVVSAAAGAVDGAEGFMSHMVVADAVRIECANVRPYYADRCFGEAPAPIDDGDAGYTATSGWQNVVSGDSVGGSHRMIPASTAGESITHEFTNLTPGQYGFYTYFKPAPGQATNARYVTYDGPFLIDREVVDQTKDYTGADLDGDGRQWYKLGSYEVHQETVRVVSTGYGDGTVVSDAVRIVCDFGTRVGCNDGIYGRTCRRQNATDYGATTESEQAVEDGLNWLSRHQYADGSWSYDHQAATSSFIPVPEPCNGACGDPGNTASARVAATGMALLPFLAAGIGPSDATYGEVVTQGINFLLSRVGETGNLVSSGVQYSGYEQAIGSLALVEALGVCRSSGFGSVDKEELRAKSIAVVERIAACQDDVRGGWKYSCAHEGDVTVSGFVYPVLRRSEAVAIDSKTPSFNEATLNEVRRMLTDFSISDSIVSDPIHGDYATRYFYGIEPGKTPDIWTRAQGTSHHIARYMQLSLGAPTQAAGMQDAADDELSRIAGGVLNESYKNYYSHQFMRRMGGSHWSTWEAAMLQYLLVDNPQPTEGHVRGSWSIGGGTLTESFCGRLWDTVSSTLILQEYYRNTEASAPYTTAVLPGDRDGDGDVDNTDIIVAFSNFTGPNPDPPAPSFGRTRLQGDVHPHPSGDGDVDNLDFQEMFTNFTGPND